MGINIGSFYSSNLIGYSASVPWVRAEANIDLVNTWTKIIGNHTIKFGGDLKPRAGRPVAGPDFQPARRLYVCAGQTASEQRVARLQPATSYYNNFASFPAGRAEPGGPRSGNTYFPAYRQWELFSFAQDKWQVTPKLTMDLGLRWEFYPPATPQFTGGFSNYIPVNNTLVIAGVGGNPSNLGMNTRYTNFAPRLGFAYRLMKRL